MTTQKRIGPPKEVLEKMEAVLDKYSPGWREPKGDCAVTQDVMASEAKHREHLARAREKLAKEAIDRLAPVKDELLNLYNEVVASGITEFGPATVKVYQLWPHHQTFTISLLEIRQAIKELKDKE